MFRASQPLGGISDFRVAHTARRSFLFSLWKIYTYMTPAFIWCYSSPTVHPRLVRDGSRLQRVYSGTMKPVGDLCNIPYPKCLTDLFSYSPKSCGITGDLFFHVSSVFHGSRGHVFQYRQFQRSLQNLFKLLLTPNLQNLFPLHMVFIWNSLPLKVAEE